MAGSFRVIMSVPTHRMSVRQPPKELGQFRVGRGTNHEMPVIGQQFPSACESVENGVFFGERFVEDSGAKLSWST